MKPNVSTCLYLISDTHNKSSTQQTIQPEREPKNKIKSRKPNRKPTKILNLCSTIKMAEATKKTFEDVNVAIVPLLTGCVPIWQRVEDHDDKTLFELQKQNKNNGSSTKLFLLSCSSF